MTTIDIITLEPPPPHPDWMLIGVFATPDDNPGGSQHGDHFIYTVVDEPDQTTCLRISCVSVEGRMLGFDLGASILNRLEHARRQGRLHPGDTVVIPLGIPDEDGNWLRDDLSYWWVGEETEDTDLWCCFQGHPASVIPILWSSPLGFPDE